MIQHTYLKDLVSIHEKNGLLYLNDERYLLIPASSFGILQGNLIDNIGIERMKTFFFRHGWDIGVEDAKVISKFPSMSLEEKLSFCPVFHSLKGHVKVSITETDLEIVDECVKKLRYKGIWEDSYEAEQYIQRFGHTDSPVCYILAGYASGIFTHLTGETVFFKEHQCIAEKAPFCTWEGRFLSDWEETDYREFMNPEELPVIKELEQTYENLLNEKNNMSMVMNIDHVLTNGVIKGHDVEALLDIVEKQIKRPIIIEDLYHQVVLVKGMTRDEYEPIKKDFQAYLRKKTSIKDIAKIQHQNCTRLVSPIYLQDKIVAYCSFLYEGSDEGNYEVDSMIINRVSTLWALVLLNDKVKLESAERMKGYFFEEIMNGKFSSEEEILKKAFFIDLDFTGGYQAVHLKYKMIEEQNIPLTGFDIEIFESVAKYMSDKGIRVLIAQKEDHLLLLLPQKQFEGKKQEHIVIPFIAFLEKTLKGTAWFAGISSVRSKILEEIKDALKEAHTAVKLTTRKAPVSFFRELGILGLFINDENKTGIKLMVELTLGDLYKDLDESKMELIGTLYTFLTNGGNYEHTAEKLMISISGLRYRLSKITKLIGSEFREPEKRFHLLLTLKALMVLEEKRLDI